MKHLLLIVIAALALSAGESSAWYITIHDEPENDRRKGGVIFPLTNNTTRGIERVYGWVYRYEGKATVKPVLVSNPHIPAIKISPEEHKPGTKALYWFKVPDHLLLSEDKFGVVIYDASVRLSN